jgi:hypothetical protein
MGKQSMFFFSLSFPQGLILMLSKEGRGGEGSRGAEAI